MKNYLKEKRRIKTLHIATEPVTQSTRNNHIPVKEVDATKRLRREVVRRDGLLLLVLELLLPLVGGVHTEAPAVLISGE